MKDPQPLHRLFGLTWMDFFQGTDITVETELDLSLTRQFLDLVLIRKGTKPLPRPLPDGFDELAPFNLITFKSHREALDLWTLWELIGHFVNLRKQFSPSLNDLLPIDDFRLVVVCARFPEKLAQEIELRPVREGVYDASGFGLTIRIIVVGQLPQREHNAMLHLFSAREELLRYGQSHYRPYSPNTSTLLFQLFQAYMEVSDMPDKLKELLRQGLDEILAKLPPEERLKGLPPEERLKGLSADEVVRGLSPEALEALRRQLKGNGSSN